MKKRIISMALSLLMLTTAFVGAGCGKEDEGEGNLSIDGNTAAAMTVSIWGVKGEGTTDEAVAAVEAAMSKITQAKYNTAIELNLVSEDKYKDTIMDKMDEIQKSIDEEKQAIADRKAAEKEAKKRGETLPPLETEAPEAVAEETVLDEFGLPTTLYPDVEDDQLDIFLITDYDMLSTLNEKGALSALDDHLTGSSKLIKQYIHPTLLSAGKVNGTTVAIPNQKLIGEYTYMLVNKTLLDKYYWDIANITNLETAYDFILDVKRNEPGYTPFAGDITPINVNYFSIDGQRTVLGNMPLADKTFGDYYAPRLLFAVPAWKNHMYVQKKLEINGCVGSETIAPGDKFGVGIMKGTALDVVAYENDYHVVVLQNPQGTAENVCNGMFAVSTYTKNLDRSMEILTHLNTRSDLLNVFAYGIEGVHYELDDDGVVKKLNNDYNMKLEHAGNSFIAHIPEGEPVNYLDAAKEQNLDLMLSPYYGFEVTEDTFAGDSEFRELYDYIVNFSEQFYSDYAAAKTFEAAEAVFDEYWEICDDDDEPDAPNGGKIDMWVNGSLTKKEDGTFPTTMKKIYDDWAMDAGIEIPQD